MLEKNVSEKKSNSYQRILFLCDLKKINKRLTLKYTFTCSFIHIHRITLIKHQSNMISNYVYYYV